MDSSISMEFVDNVTRAVSSMGTNAAEEFKTIQVPIYTDVKKNMSH